MTKHEANAALCRALGVEPVDYQGKSVECAKCRRTKKPRGRSQPISSSYCDSDCPGYAKEPYVGDLWWNETGSDFGFTFSKELATPVYPDLTSADRLMAALRKSEHQFRVSDCGAEVWHNGGGFAYATFRAGETHGSMLFRAACAAFGIEVRE